MLVRVIETGPASIGVVATAKFKANAEPKKTAVTFMEKVTYH